MIEFREFPKIARLARDIIITEKIDGTNGVVYIPPIACGDEEDQVLAGSRHRWLAPGQGDNYGFAAWAQQHADELRALGPGYHFGEWWGLGIMRGYGLFERRFSLFNVTRCGDLNVRPACCGVVPILYMGPFSTDIVEAALAGLRGGGSKAAPGYMKPEGVVIYHTAANVLFKKTLEGDAVPKARALQDGPRFDGDLYISLREAA